MDLSVEAAKAEIAPSLPVLQVLVPSTTTLHCSQPIPHKLRHSRPALCLVLRHPLYEARILQ